jgi:acyl-CoA synthetase (AMP-forming)/AMP-acid ligase II
VAIFMKNCPDYLVVLYGIWIAGAVAVPVNAKLHGREAAWIAENSGARLGIVTADPGAGLAKASGCRPDRCGRRRFRRDDRRRRHPPHAARGR